MSRIGRLPIVIPQGVTVDIDANQNVTVTGPKGTLTQWVDACIKVVVENSQVVLTRSSEEKEVKSKHGLYRALIQNMVTGVVNGFAINLIIKGVGYKVAKTGNKVTFSVGYSHPVEFVEPEGITIDVVSVTEVSVKGIDKAKVGQVAANIRYIRKPEPYHGYGIRYKDETIVMKEGKSGKK
ncbi:MAG: 50S ribosomal protein L6 [Clostridia bacterium]|nr:50S ribosomal protein L6 [Clostridia bacterium]